MLSGILKTVLDAAHASNVEWIGDTLYSSNKTLLSMAAPIMTRRTSHTIEEVTGIERAALSAIGDIPMYAIRASDGIPAIDKEIDPAMNVQGFMSEEYIEASDGKMVAILKTVEGNTLIGISGIDVDRFNRASCQGEAKVDAIRRFFK